MYNYILNNKYTIYCKVSAFSLCHCSCHQYQRELPNRQRCRSLPPSGKWLLFFITLHHSAAEQTHRYETSRKGLLTQFVQFSLAVRRSLTFEHMLWNPSLLVSVLNSWTLNSSMWQCIRLTLRWRILSLKNVCVHVFACMLIEILLCLQIDRIDFIMRPISLQECIMKGP